MTTYIRPGQAYCRTKLPGLLACPNELRVGYKHNTNLHKSHLEVEPSCLQPPCMPQSNSG